MREAVNKAVTMLAGCRDRVTGKRQETLKGNDWK